MAAGSKRTELIAFYVSIDEKKRIKELARKADMSVSDYSRKVLMGRIQNEYGVESK